MNMIIIICEGENDSYLIERILDDLNTNYITTSYLKTSYKDIRGIFRKADTIIFKANGKENVYEAIKILVSRLRSGYIKILPKIAVILDRNHENVYETAYNKICSYIETPCTFHPNNAVPDVKKIASKSKIEIRYKRGNRILNIYIHEIEDSLEYNIKKSLGKNYPRYINFDSHTFINAIVNNHFNGDKKKFFKEALNLMENEPWLKNLKNFIENLVRGKNED